MPLVSHPHTRAIAVAVFVTILWSSSWVLIRVGLDDEDLAPLTFAGIRYTVAAVALTAWIGASTDRRHELRHVDRALWRRLVSLGVVFIAVTQGAQFMAIDNQPAATTSLTLAPTALLVAVLSKHLIGERPSRRQIVGAMLIAVGAATYFAGDLGATIVGMTAALVGLGANVSSALLGRSINRSATVSPAVVTVISMAIGSSLLLATGFVFEGWPTLTGRLVLIVVWLGVVNTAFAFTLWNWSLRRLAAVESAAVNNTMLVQIAVLAWLFLGEAPGLVGGLGILTVTAGTYLSTLRRMGPSSGTGTPPMRVVLATANPTKRAWLSHGLASDRIVISDTAAPEVDETGSTCEENARIKALSIGPLSDAVVIAEDSALFVEGLGGFPGTRTGRWCEGSDDDRAASLAALCAGLSGDDRRARFESVVVVLYPSGRLESHHGVLDGSIRHTVCGRPGDGYSAVFESGVSPRERHTNQRPLAGGHRHQALESARRHIERAADAEDWNVDAR